MTNPSISPNSNSANSTRVCVRCKQEKPLNQFVKDARRLGGYGNTCKSCHNISSKRYDDAHRLEQKAWREAHKEERAESGRQYRSANREHVATVKQQWVEKNRDKVKVIQKRWKTNHPDKVREIGRRNYYNNRKRRIASVRAYQLRNPDKVREINARRWARLHDAEGDHTASDLEQIKIAQTDTKGRLRCWYCGKPIKASPHLDHKIPLSRHGSNDPSNLCFTCPRCNMSKGARTPEEFGGRLL